MKKVAVYARVSTERQEEQKTIQSQLAELREICKGFQVVKEYIDDGWSGETLDRPELDKLRNDIKEGLFEAIYIHSVDRLSRNLYQQGIIVEELKKNGIELFIGNKPIEDTPEAELLFNMLGAVSQYERSKILERTKRGKLYKARKGIVVGTGAPFGYDYIKKTKEREGYYKLNPEKAEILKLVFNLYLELESICGVAKELTKRKIKPPKGIAWRQSSLKRILTDESYIGTTYFNKTQAIEGNSNDKKYRKIVNSRRRKRDKRTYRCNNRSKRFPFPQDCKSPQISGEKLEDAVWDSISESILKPEILIKHIWDLNNKISEDKEYLKNEKQKHLKRKNSLSQKKSRLLDIFTEGVILRKDYLEKMNELNQEEERLDLEIKKVENKLNQAVKRPLFVSDIKYFCNLARERIVNFTFQEKQRFLRYLIDQIILDSKKRKAKIIGYIPVENSQIIQNSLKSVAEYSISS